MGNCMSNEKLNGIIDNQSSYEIIYHVSGSMREVSEFQQELNVGPKIGVGMDGVDIGGINYGTKKHSTRQKYYSEARVPNHSFCSAGLNNIEVGCFLSIYATKVDHSGNQVYKKLILKDICIRTNQDICLRIKGDLKVVQLSQKDIEQLKSQMKNSGSTLVSTFKSPNPTDKLSSQEISDNTTVRLHVNTEYLQKKFGHHYKNYYVQYQQTGLFDLNHSEVQIDMKEFLKYDWAYLQSLQLDGCNIGDDGWSWLCASAKFYFPNLKCLYLADNNITTILQGDLENFPSLKVIELDYSDVQGTNPLNDDSKKYILKFALQHPQVSIYCGNIDEAKYMPAESARFPPPTKYVDQNAQYTYPSNSDPNWKWFLILPPQMNATREETSTLRKSAKPKTYPKENKTLKT